jgi:hypothetical protein
MVYHHQLKFIVICNKASYPLVFFILFFLFRLLWFSWIVFQAFVLINVLIILLIIIIQTHSVLFLIWINFILIWWTESFLAILPLFIILIALLLFFFLYTLLLTWIFGSILKDLTKLVWVTAAWFINFRYSILRIFLYRFIYFLLNVILAWSFVESSPLCTHFVIARWLFSNAEIFCIVILVYFILTIFLFLVL